MLLIELIIAMSWKIKILIKSIHIYLEKYIFSSLKSAAKTCDSGNLKYLPSEIMEKVICFAYNVGSQEDGVFWTSLGHTTRPCCKEIEEKRKKKKMYLCWSQEHKIEKVNLPV